MLETLFQMLVFPGFLAAFVIGFVYMGLMRKVTARMQHRVGPPIKQPIFDFFKLMSKENIVTRDSVPFLLTLCPIISFASMLTVIIFVPIGTFGLVSFPGSVFVVIYFLLMSSAFLAIAGFATGNPFGSLGSIREITQMVSYELPFIISLVTVGMLTGFRVSPFLAIGFPFAFLAFLTGILGKLSLPPFHIPEAEQEIVAGPYTEYSGPRLAMFELARAASFWVLISLGAVLFLGAGSVAFFFIDSAVLLFIVIVFRAIFARLRISNAFRLYWFVIAPLAVIDLVRVMVGFY